MWVKTKTGSGLAMTLGIGVLTLLAAPMTCAQTPAVAGPDSGAQVMFSSGGLASDENPGQGVPGEIVRELDDPHTGDRWLLVRNDQFPGGPGRLVSGLRLKANLTGVAALRTGWRERESAVPSCYRHRRPSDCRGAHGAASDACSGGLAR